MSQAVKVKQEINVKQEDKKQFKDMKQMFMEPGDQQEITQEDTWAIIGAFFNKYGFVQQQIASYNNFLSMLMKEIIDEAGPIELNPMQSYSLNEKLAKRLRYEIEFDQLHIYQKPIFEEQDGSLTHIYPNQARLRGLTYESKIYVDLKKRVIEINTETGEEKVVLNEQEDKVEFGKIPIMVRSQQCALSNLSKEERIKVGECEYDEGGYFIINGNEKVVVAQERMANNLVYIFQKKPPSHYSYIAEIRSVQLGSSDKPSLFSVKIFNKVLKHDKSVVKVFRCQLPYVREDIPLVILLKALGYHNDQEIFQILCSNLNDKQIVELLKPSFEEAAPIDSSDAALDIIARRTNQAHFSTREERISLGRQILEKKLLPHMNPHISQKKAFFIGYMVQKLCNVALGRSDTDDRDHYSKKRLDMVGMLFVELFKTKFKQFKKETEAYLLKELNKKSASGEINIKKAFAKGLRTITEGFRYALATGNWSKPHENRKCGVAQVLQRQNYFSTIAHCRRLNTPIAKTTKTPRPRLLHNTHWGIICPTETPEGQSCGLVKNFALMANVSIKEPTEELDEFLQKSLGMKNINEIEPKDLLGKTKIFINGCWIGIHDKASWIINQLRELRRKGQMPISISLIYDIQNNEIKMFTDPGRPMRPLLIVEDNKIKVQKQHIIKLFLPKNNENFIDFEFLLTNGLVEFLDVEEEENAMIAMNIQKLKEADKQCIQYTHCEIHPAMILGVATSLIPFADHNQSPRNVYQAGMGKQAIGIYALNQQLRMNTLWYFLYYPQKPLSITKPMEFFHANEMPTGENAIVAIASFSGYNQEDSIILNQSAIDRGMFRAIFYRTYTDFQIDDENKSEEFCRPPVAQTMDMRLSCYDKLDIDGFTIPGLRVSGDDILIGKVAKIRGSEKIDFGRKIYKDASMAMRRNENGSVDQVMLTTNADGYKTVRVQVRSIRIPQIGDKFASRHGQKGTVGMVFRQEDMPFTIDGIVPDIIINPHAIPSRMTIGHLIECLQSKVAALSGKIGDATPFSGIQVQDIAEQLHKLGFQKYGNERLYNPHTGEPMACTIFIGPTYYQRLKHMIDDKIHSRARGPVQNLNRQPTEGRSKDGGLRFGEMERDCIISHGAAKVLKEKLVDVSDAYRIHVCEECGMMAIANLQKNEYECKVCADLKHKKTKINQIVIPYACKLLIQELLAMNIVPRLVTQSVR